MASIGDLKDELSKKIGFEVLEQEVSENRAVFLGRINKDRVSSALLVAQKLLKDQGSGWSAELSKVFLLKGSALVHAWRFIFLADADLEDAVPSILSSVRSAEAPVRRRLDSIALPGGARHRLHYKNGKGAGLYGKHPVGKNVIGAK